MFIVLGRTPSELIFFAKGGVYLGFLLSRDCLGGAEFPSKQLTLVSLSYKTNPRRIQSTVLQKCDLQIATIYTMFMLEPCLNIPEKQKLLHLR